MSDRYPSGPAVFLCIAALALAAVLVTAWGPQYVDDTPTPCDCCGDGGAR